MKKQAFVKEISKDQINPNPSPINIGVTGHRDLRPEDKAKLSEKIHSIYINLQKKYHNSSFILFSSLAEGADRLAAEVALERDYRLIVPLPLEQEEFEEDFPDEGSRADFRRLVTRADKRFTLPLADGCTSENIKKSGRYRDMQYDQASAYIVSNCSILIALWDGKEENHVSKVINWHQRGLPQPFMSSFVQTVPADETITYHIVTPRKSNPDPPGAFSIKQLIRVKRHNDNNDRQACFFI